MDDGGRDDRRLEPGSPEWEEERKRRRGHPHGPHVRLAEPDEPMRAYVDASPEQRLLDAFERRLGAHEQPKNPWTSMGAVLGAVVAVISIAGAVVSVLQGYTQLGERVQSFGERMLANDSRITVLEHAFQERGQKRDGEVAALNSSNALQDDRMKNFAVAIQQEREARMDAEADLRRTNSDTRAQINDLSKAMSEIKSDLKVLVDRAQRPHSEVATPQRDAQAGGR